MAAIVLGLERRIEDGLLGDMLEHGHRIIARLGSAREIIAAIDAGSGPAAPAAVIVSATRQTLSADLLAACDRRGIRLIALAADAAARAHAAAIGLHEVVDAAAPWSEIEALLAAGLPLLAEGGPLGPADAAPRAARVIAVWGPAGAPGRTTVSVNLAAEIAATGHSVVLADVDSYGGSVAPVLGLLDESPGFAAACRLSASGKLTRAELERLAQRYDSPHGSFWVLTGISRAERWPELGAERVAATIAACREWVDFVVVDVGFCIENDEEIVSDLFAPRRNAATLAVLAEADHLVAVGLADPVGMSRFLRGLPALAEIAPSARLGVVMNRVRASAVGLDPHGQVRQTLRRFGGIEQATLLPHDLNAVDTAVFDGRTLRDSAPRSAVRLALQALAAEELVPVPQAERGKRPRWSARLRPRAAEHVR